MDEVGRARDFSIERRHAETETNRGCFGLGMTAIVIGVFLSAAQMLWAEPGASETLVLLTFRLP